MLVASRVLILALGLLLLVGIVAIIVLAIVGAGKSKEIKGEEFINDTQSNTENIPELVVYENGKYLVDSWGSSML